VYSSSETYFKLCEDMTETDTNDRTRNLIKWWPWQCLKLYRIVRNSTDPLSCNLNSHILKISDHVHFWPCTLLLYQHVKHGRTYFAMFYSLRSNKDFKKLIGRS
jgi:hypothetical protein